MRARTDLDVARDLCMLKSFLMDNDMVPLATLVGEAIERVAAAAVASAMTPSPAAAPMTREYIAAEVNRVLTSSSRFPEACNVVELYPGIGASRA
jgi:hypothetical protein